MNVQELRERCLPLFRCRSITECIALLDIYSNFFFRAIQIHQMDEVDSVSKAQAKIVLQMMMTKTLHLKSVISGIHYTAEDGGELKGIIDPTIVAALIRNVYETVGMFNLIYRTPQSSDEQLILYNLWVHAGLSYRQRFTAIITTEENKKKSDDERNMMQNLVNEIENTTLYKGLSEKNKNKIQQKLRDKDYLLKFENGEVLFLHWHQLANVMGITGGLLDDIYTYFSLYSHPSNVSVFQFADMFRKENPEFLQITIFNLRNLFILISVIVADYIVLFPQVLNTFNNLPLIHQLAINFHNKYARGNEDRKSVV